MKKLLVAVPILVVAVLVLVSVRPARVVHAQTSHTSPPPGDPMLDGYRPAPPPPQPLEGVPLVARPADLQQQITQDIQANQSRTASRDATQGYAKGVIRRARLAQAIRTAGMEVRP